MNPLGNLTYWEVLRTSDNYVKYGLMCLGAGGWLLFTSVTGFLEVQIKGIDLFNTWLNSTPIRVVCFVLSVGFLVVAAWIFRHLLSAIHNP
jgi:hypothetical protein